MRIFQYASVRIAVCLSGPYILRNKCISATSNSWTFCFCFCFVRSRYSAVICSCSCVCVQSPVVVHIVCIALASSCSHYINSTQFADGFSGRDIFLANIQIHADNHFPKYPFAHSLDSCRRNFTLEYRLTRCH